MGSSYTTCLAALEANPWTTKAASGAQCLLISKVLNDAESPKSNLGQVGLAECVLLRYRVSIFFDAHRREIE